MATSSGYESPLERKEVINSLLDSLTENSRDPDESCFHPPRHVHTLYFTLIYWNLNRRVQI